MTPDPATVTEVPANRDLAGRERAAGFAAGLVVGALLGAGIALLLAPDRGSRTRRRLRRRLRLERGRRPFLERLERAANRARGHLG